VFVKLVSFRKAKEVEGGVGDAVGEAIGAEKLKAEAQLQMQTQRLNAGVSPLRSSRVRELLRSK
jgi:hypothetical protein